MSNRLRKVIKMNSNGFAWDEESKEKVLGSHTYLAGKILENY